MSVSGDGQLRLARSGDQGRSWRFFSTVPGISSGGYFTRLGNGDLLLTSFAANPKQVAWVRSTDDGGTWSQPRPILALTEHLYGWGPVCVMQDGRWAYCPYRQVGDKEFQALLTWSEDEGRT